MVRSVAEEPAAGAATARLHAGFGSSDDDDGWRAGRQAAAAAVAGLGAGNAALVVVYASVRYDLEALLAGVREITGDTPLVGASSSGHFACGELTDAGRGVAVMAATAGPYRFGVGHAPDLRADPASAGHTLARSARAAAGGGVAPHAAFLALPCGLDVDHQELLNGIYRVTGAAVPVVGGASSDDRAMRETYVFRDGDVLSDAAVGVWIESPHPVRVVRAHGWQPRGLPLPITSAEGPLVHTIAGSPALEVFRRNLEEARRNNDLGAEQPVDVPNEPIVRLAEAGRCLGIIEPDGSRTLRGVFADESGAVRTWLPLPPYAAVQIMTCTQDQLLDACDELPWQARGDHRPGVLLSFSCVARLRMLGERGPEEARRLQDAAGDVPVFGFYSYGELARISGLSGVHNATITAVAL